MKRTIGNLVIKQAFNSGGTQTAKTEHYLLKDHLGSPSLIMDKIAQVQQTMDFDPWGARRNTNWAAMSSTELTNTFFKNHSISNSVGIDSLTSRGFTGHEMLDEVGVIHMNGRIYDAKLGRFLQADPIIQDRFDTQSLNRYSYTNNNPLNAIDPSGFSFFKKLFTIVKIIAAVVLTVACGGVCGPAVWAWTFGTIGAIEAAAMGGNFGDVLLGAFTGAVTAYAGAAFLKGGLTLLEAFKLGVIGGITNILHGGKFGHGFVSGGAGAYIGSKIGGFVKGAENALRNTGTFIARVTLGGALSKATGGKFANGAGYAAFSAAVSYAATPSGGNVDTETSRTKDGKNSDLTFKEAKKILVDKKLLPADVANDPELLVDETQKAAIKPAGISEADLKSSDIRLVASWKTAQALVDSGEWQHIDGSHTGGIMKIFMSATKPSFSQYLSRTASIGLGPAVPLTGSQNLVQTIHHEYLHYIGVESHVTNPAGWGIRMRDDIGGWINDI